MATELRKLRIRRVALVDRGANQDADVELFKRDAPREVDFMAEEQAVSKADLDAALEQVAKAQQEKADAEAAAAKAAEEAAEVKAELAKRDEAAEVAKYDGEAKALPFLGDKGGVWLRTISKALGDEYEAFKTAIVSVAKVNEAVLTKELGTAGGDRANDPNEVAKGIATEILKTEPTLTMEQAMLRAYQNPIVQKAFQGGTD